MGSTPRNGIVDVAKGDAAVDTDVPAITFATCEFAPAVFVLGFPFGILLVVDWAAAGTEDGSVAAAIWARAVMSMGTAMVTLAVESPPAREPPSLCSPVLSDSDETSLSPGFEGRLTLSCGATAPAFPAWGDAVLSNTPEKSLASVLPD